MHTDVVVTFVSGDRIFTSHDRIRELGWSGEDCIGLGAFWFDSVVVDRAVYTNTVTGHEHLYNEGNFNEYQPHTPFDLPYWLMLPRKSSSKAAILTPTTPSASRVGFTSLRLEPTFMILGQAAGTAASLAIAGEVHPRDVNRTQLQHTLSRMHQRIRQGDLREDDWVPCGVTKKP